MLSGAEQRRGVGSLHAAALRVEVSSGKVRRWLACRSETLAALGRSIGRVRDMMTLGGKGSSES